MKNLNKGIFTIAATIVFSMTTQAQRVAYDRVYINSNAVNSTAGYFFADKDFDGLTIVGGSNTIGTSDKARKINLLAEAGLAVRITETGTGTNKIVHGMYIGGATKYVSNMTKGNKLFVEGNIGASGKISTTDYEVTAAGNMPDYVFANDYKIPTLSETEAYIKANKHLPAFKSAKEMEEKGYSVMDMDRSLLQTVEEMTLHAIAQEKKMLAQEDKILAQEKQFDAQEKKIAQLESEMAAIKALLLKK
jgi:hypothetical protein